MEMTCNFKRIEKKYLLSRALPQCHRQGDFGGRRGQSGQEF